MNKNIAHIRKQLKLTAYSPTLRRESIALKMAITPNIAMNIRITQNGTLCILKIRY